MPVNRKALAMSSHALTALAKFAPGQPLSIAVGRRYDSEQSGDVD
jgi:hypothetical protein